MCTLLAAASGARVVGIDAAPRLLEVARGRATSLAVDAEFRAGDLLDLPVQDGAADVAFSVFGRRRSALRGRTGPPWSCWLAR